MKEKYTCADVEKLLREIAAQERKYSCTRENLAEPHECEMDDAMTQRLLAVIDNEGVRTTRTSYYKLLASCAAVVLLASIGCFFLLDSHLVEVASVREASTMASPQARSLKVANRTLLSHLDATTESGFSPAPQETYEGRDKRRYGVSVHGTYEYTACTDTL